MYTVYTWFWPTLLIHMPPRTWLGGRQIQRARDRGLLGADAGGGEAALFSVPATSITRFFINVTHLAGRQTS